MHPDHDMNSVTDYQRCASYRYPHVHSVEVAGMPSLPQLIPNDLIMGCICMHPRACPWPIEYYINVHKVSCIHVNDIVHALTL